MARRRIFLVDDNPDFISASRRFLSFEPDIEVVGWAASGREALEQVPRLRPDLVLMDLTMPKMNGLETTRRLKAQPFRPAVVILTVHQSEEFRAAAEAAGADSFISKSDLVEQLPPFLRTLFQGSVKIPQRPPTSRCPSSATPLEILGCGIEERFHAMVEFAPDAMVIVDRMGCIALVNAQTENLFGYRREEILGRNVELLIPERLHAAYIEQRNRYLANPLPRPMSSGESLYAIRKDGSEFPIEISLSPIQTGPVALFAASIRDITERKQAMDEHLRLLETVERQRAELQMIFDSVPALIFYKDHEHRLVRVNQAHAQCYGLPKEQIEGKTDAELGSPYAEDYLQDDLSVMKTGEPLRGVIEQFHTPTGTRWIQTEKVPHRDAQGNIIGLVGLAVDITERKQLEEQLRQSQKLEAIGQLAGGIAHDFNNLLTIINGYSEILLEETGSNDPRYTMLEEIGHAGRRAAALTHQLLAFSRKQVLEPRVLDLNSLVVNMERMLGRLISEDIELHTLVAPEPAHVLADPGQLEQVVLNLVVNACDAMPRGGQLTIETASVSMPGTYREVPPGDYVQLIVRDTGCGMDVETRNHIFEPFFTTKELGKGTGLGLATVFGIVKQSDGHILVDTEPGMGACFRIYLPKANRSLSCPASNRYIRAAAQGHETILLVEDDDDVRALVLRILRGHGYRVLEAIDGDDALHLVEQYSGPIHLVITDLVMPRLRGDDLVRRLSVQRPDLKVLFVSGYSQNISVEQGLLSGQVFVLPKPFTPVALGIKVREVLEHPKLAANHSAGCHLDGWARS